MGSGVTFGDSGRNVALVAVGFAIAAGLVEGFLMVVLGHVVLTIREIAQNSWRTRYVLRDGFAALNSSRER
jgi:hypothetical protein